MKHRYLRTLLVLLLSMLSLGAHALPFTFTFAAGPAGGAVSGLPGQTVGWGYQLVNTDSSNWFVPTQLNVSSFSLGVPDASYFDFPILAPGASVDAAFDALLHTGLYGVQIFPFALAGQSDSGLFTVSGEWWSGDPLAGGIFLQAADGVQAAYSLTVAAAALPLPGSLPLLALGAALLLARQRRRQEGAHASIGLG
ncbi:PEP-CTERM protein-sorting domain-containing protein [Duganella sp. CF402]|uniref:hypothetical protein n=1 Tax=unclassified Duganella TaxID=2636909 RepID=UPI0008AC1939|nr:MULTISPECIES: hypothetical protein [unclassified Duganella]RZT10226.1 putative secreted protein with PEP-CTERM sorting signal [Duganella sp. BK701]SEL22737.1 PEP-CTERM protein-sorting domain-containing protein [Duganella sp. CF402]